MTLEAFRTAFPEFADVDEPTFDGALDDARALSSAPDHPRLGYLIAHALVLRAKMLDGDDCDAGPGGLQTTGYGQFYSWQSQAAAVPVTAS